MELEKVFLITAEKGLHSRPATRLVDKAMSYKSEIFMESQGRKVNIKSIMGVMSLGVYKGQEVKIICDGEDAQKAISEITDFLVMEKLGRLA